MDNITIKVTTEVLQSKAGTVDGLIDKMNHQYNDLYRHIKSISCYWKGEAAAKNIERCETDKKQVETMLRRLKEYPEDLREVAGIYDTGEKAAVDSMSALPFDVII